MAVQIDEIRVSFIWAETIVDHFASAKPGFLGRDYEYEKRFERIRKGFTDPLGLTLPWPRPKGQMFWTYYLEGKSLATVPKRKAWKAPIPLRKRLSYDLVAPWFDQTLRIVPEVFVYPHGQVVVLTFTCCAALDLTAAIATAHAMRHKDLELKTPDATLNRSLAGIAETMLDDSRGALFGRNVKAARSSPTPFSVVTVVRGSGPDASSPVDQDSPIHRALDAWTTWRASYQTDLLPKLSDRRFKIHSPSPGHVHYGCKRGRAIWFPGLFTLENPTRRTLSCYHRNQVFAAAQTESLGELAREVASRLREGDDLKGMLKDCSRRASGALGRLYGGIADYTYRSWSTRAQIEQNFLSSINEVRKVLDMSALS